MTNRLHKGHVSCALGYSAMLQPIEDILDIGDVHWVVVAYSVMLRPVADIYGSWVMCIGLYWHVTSN